MSERYMNLYRVDCSSGVFIPVSDGEVFPSLGDAVAGRKNHLGAKYVGTMALEPGQDGLSNGRGGTKWWAMHFPKSGLED